MRKWLNNYFDLSKREFNGLLALTLLILLISAAPYTYELTKTSIDDNNKEQHAIKEIILGDSAATGYVKEKPLIKKHKYTGRHSLFYFDPNVISAAEWQKLGLSAKQSASVLKYISKGGRFKKTEDLQKMYTISAVMYARLAPFVKITNKEAGDERSFKGTDHPEPASRKPQFKIVEINQADSARLEEIRGIGPVFAGRIIKYRARIGGFYKKEQLMEVFGLDTIKYNEIKDQVTANPAYLKKINVNTAQIEDFKGHPYIRYKQVNALIQYRIQHGNYSSIEDLKRVVILNSETIARLKPYLAF